MANEILDRKARFEDIYTQRATNPQLYAGLQEDAHFTRRGPVPTFVDSVTLGPEPSKLDPSLEGKVELVTLKVGATPKKQQLRKFEQKKGNDTGSIAKFMAESDAFESLGEEIEVNMAIVRVKDLVPNPKGPYATTEEIFGREDNVDSQGNSAPFTKGKMSELGLYLLPHQATLDYANEKGDEVKMGNPLWFATKPIADRDGSPELFGVGRDFSRLRFDSRWAGPSSGWAPGRRIAFSLSQVVKAA